MHRARFKRYTLLAFEMSCLTFSWALSVGQLDAFPVPRQCEKLLCVRHPFLCITEVAFVPDTQAHGGALSPWANHEHANFLIQPGALHWSFPHTQHAYMTYRKALIIETCRVLSVFLFAWLGCLGHVAILQTGSGRLSALGCHVHGLLWFHCRRNGVLRLLGPPMHTMHAEMGEEKGTCSACHLIRRDRLRG